MNTFPLSPNGNEFVFIKHLARHNTGSLIELYIKCNRSCQRLPFSIYHLFLRDTFFSILQGVKKQVRGTTRCVSKSMIYFQTSKHSCFKERNQALFQMVFSGKNTKDHFQTINIAKARFRSNTI